MEIVTLRVTASGQLGDVSMPTCCHPAPAIPQTPWSTGAECTLMRCRVSFRVPSTIRERLHPEATIVGPAILEGMDSTVVINPGWETRIDQYGNCIMRATGE